MQTYPGSFGEVHQVLLSYLDTAGASLSAFFRALTYQVEGPGSPVPPISLSSPGNPAVATVLNL